MRKILFSAVLFLTGVGVSAQGRQTDTDVRLLDECRSLFMQGDYSAAGSLLAEWNKVAYANGLLRTEEVSYMQVVIDAQRDLNTAMPAIEKFMSEYPNSIYNNRMQALMGSCHFAQHEYDEAIECFDECDPLLLNDEDCRRMVRHNAISLIRLGRNDEGFLQLSILERLVDDPEEDEDLIFYKAYVDYVNGRTEQAKEGFENSLESSHVEEARLYLAELDLRGNGDHSVARRTAEDMIDNLEDPYLEAEAERIHMEAEKRLEAGAEKVAASLEPVALIRADLIGAQNDLIALLYDEQTATDDMKKLKPSAYLANTGSVRASMSRLRNCL